MIFFFLIFYRQVSILMDHPLSFFFTLDYVFTKYSYDACTPKISMRILGFPPLYNPLPLKTTSSKTTQEYNAYIFMDYTSTLKTLGTPSISQITLIFDINREFKLHLFFNNVIKHFKKTIINLTFQIYLSFTMPYMWISYMEILLEIIDL